MNALKQVSHNGVTYFIDVRLGEIRPVEQPFNPTKFSDIEDDELYTKVEDKVWEYEFEQAGIETLDRN